MALVATGYALGHESERALSTGARPASKASQPQLSLWGSEALLLRRLVSKTPSKTTLTVVQANARIQRPFYIYHGSTHYEIAIAQQEQRHMGWRPSSWLPGRQVKAPDRLLATSLASNKSFIPLILSARPLRETGLTFQVIRRRLILLCQLHWHPKNAACLWKQPERQPNALLRNKCQMH